MSTIAPARAESGALATMHPAYFALAMATGIVSIAAHRLGLTWIAQALFALNGVFYVAVWTAAIARVVRHRDAVRADLLHHGRSVGFFTTVAATCVLGSQCLTIGGWREVALGLFIFGIALLVVLTYGLLTILTVKPDKPSLAEGINGGWLLAVVAAQAVSVLGAQLAPGLGGLAHVTLLFALVLWLGGGMLYFWIIALIFYRYTFFPMSPSDLAPPYWINMGAAAISTLAGTVLIASAPSSTLLEQILPFVRGSTLMWWATATWWIPMLLILGVWRHVYRRFPLRYDPLYWGAVFPLGMYTVCTHRLAESVEAPELGAIAQVFVFVALGAWTLVAVGMVASLVTQARSR